MRKTGGKQDNGFPEAERDRAGDFFGNTKVRLGAPGGSGHERLRLKAIATQAPEAGEQQGNPDHNTRGDQQKQ